MKINALIALLMLALCRWSVPAYAFGGGGRGGGGGGGSTQLLDCPSSTFAGLPGSPTVAQCFFVTNAQSCVAQTPVTSTGSMGCTVTWTGTQWMPAGNVTSSAAGGVTSVALAVPSQFTVSGSPITSSGTITVGYTANSLAAHNFGTGISVNGLLTGAQPGAADISAGTFGGAFTFSTGPTMSGANISSGTIPDASLVTAPVTSVTGTAPVASSGGATPAISITGAAGDVLAGAGPAFTATPTLGVNGTTTGTLALDNSAGGGAAWTLSGGATTAWTLTPKATVPVQGDLFTWSNSTGQMASVADTTVGDMLLAQGATTVPAYEAISGAGDLGTTTLSGAGVLNSQVSNLSHVTNASLASSGLANTAVTAGSYTNTNLTVNAEGQITAASSGSAAATPGFINTPTVSAGAVTLLDQCTSAGCTDYNRIANGTNTSTLAVTTAAAASMHDGQAVDVEVDMNGTNAPSSITWTGGTGVTLNYGVLGNAATATVCGTPSATGSIIAKWQWDSSTGDLTLRACGPVPSATALSENLGGTNADLHTATGIIRTGSGTASAAELSGDVTTSGSNAATVVQIEGAAIPTSATIVGTNSSKQLVAVTTPLSVANGGTASSTGALLTTSSTNGNVFGIGFDFIGTPTASMIEATNLVYEISVPANYATPTSSCTCGTNPGETDAYTVKCNGSSQGTFSLSTSCVLTLPTNSAYTCTAGQRFELDAPATVSGKDIACTVAYTR